MDEFKEYLRFSDIETTKEYTSILEKYNIPFEVDDSSMRLKVVSTTTPWEDQYVLKVKDSDFERVNNIIETEIPVVKRNIPVEHYLYTFSDDDLLKIIHKQNDWTSEEVSLAKKILKSRNIEIPEVTISSFSFPEKPIVKKRDKTIVRSLISVILFISAYLFFFNSTLSFVLILVIVLFIHESGHFIAMKYFKYADVKMFFIPLLGALVTGERKSISQKQRAVILLAGPVPGIMIGTIIYAIGIINDNQLLIKTANIFIFLNAFNLFPITPLDGGNLIDTLFFFTKEKLHLIFSIISIAGLITISYYLHAYVLFIIPFFMLIQIRQQTKVKSIKAALDEAGINYNKPYEELTNQEYWLIRSQVISHMEILNKINPDEYTVSESEGPVINQVKSLATTPLIKDLSAPAKLLFAIVWFVFLVSPIIIRMIIK